MCVGEGMGVGRGGTGAAAGAGNGGVGVDGSLTNAVIGLIYEAPHSRLMVKEG